MNIHEIYNLLMAGKTIRLEFPSKQHAETFRVALARYKSRQETHLVGIGMLTPEECQRFSFKLQLPLPLDGNSATAEMRFTDRVTRKQYSVRIVDDEEDYGREAAD